MQTIYLTLAFLKKPLKSLLYLVTTLCFSMMSIYAARPDIRTPIFNTGLIKSVIVIAIPEFLTMLILLRLLCGYHIIFKIKTVVPSLQGISLYQLIILPVFLTAHFFFYPLTFSVRYLIRHYSDCSFEQYLSALNESMIIETYFLYLPYVLFLGYLVLNISLSKDYFRQSANYSTDNPVVLELEDVITSAKIAAVADNEDLKYDTILKVRGPVGDTFVKTEECIYFEAADHGSMAHHPEGMFKISVSLINLEKQLDTCSFFKISPKYIINLAYLDSYVYADKGQYALYLKKPINVSFTITRSRIDPLKTTFQQYMASK